MDSVEQALAALLGSPTKGSERVEAPEDREMEDSYLAALLMGERGTPPEARHQHPRQSTPPEDVDMAAVNQSVDAKLKTPPRVMVEKLPQNTVDSFTALSQESTPKKLSTATSAAAPETSGGHQQPLEDASTTTPRKRLLSSPKDTQPPKKPCREGIGPEESVVPCPPSTSSGSAPGKDTRGSPGVKSPVRPPGIPVFGPGGGSSPNKGLGGGGGPDRSTPPSSRAEPGKRVVGRPHLSFPHRRFTGGKSAAALKRIASLATMDHPQSDSVSSSTPTPTIRNKRKGRPRQRGSTEEEEEEEDPSDRDLGMKGATRRKKFATRLKVCRVLSSESEESAGPFASPSYAAAKKTKILDRPKTTSNKPTGTIGTSPFKIHVKATAKGITICKQLPRAQETVTVEREAGKGGGAKDGEQTSPQQTEREENNNRIKDLQPPPNSAPEATDDIEETLKRLDGFSPNTPRPRNTTTPISSSPANPSGPSPVHDIDSGDSAESVSTRIFGRGVSPAKPKTTKRNTSTETQNTNQQGTSTSTSLQQSEEERGAVHKSPAKNGSGGKVNEKAQGKGKQRKQAEKQSPKKQKQTPKKQKQSPEVKKQTPRKQRKSPNTKKQNLGCEKKSSGSPKETSQGSQVHGKKKQTAEGQKNQTPGSQKQPDTQKQPDSQTQTTDKQGQASDTQKQAKGDQEQTHSPSPTTKDKNLTPDKRKAIDTPRQRDGQASDSQKQTDNQNNARDSLSSSTSKESSSTSTCPTQTTASPHPPPTAGETAPSCTDKANSHHSSTSSRTPPGHTTAATETKRPKRTRQVTSSDSEVSEVENTSVEGNTVGVSPTQPAERQEGEQSGGNKDDGRRETEKRNDATNGTRMECQSKRPNDHDATDDDDDNSNRRKKKGNTSGKDGDSSNKSKGSDNTRKDKDSEGSNNRGGENRGNNDSSSRGTSEDTSRKETQEKRSQGSTNNRGEVKASSAVPSVTEQYSDRIIDVNAEYRDPMWNMAFLTPDYYGRDEMASPQQASSPGKYPLTN